MVSSSRESEQRGRGCEKNPSTALAKQNHVTNFGGLVLNRIEAEIHKPCITKTFVEMYKMYAPLQRSNLKKRPKQLTTYSTKNWADAHKKQMFSYVN